MASSSSRVQPAAFGGYGRQIQAGVPDPTRGGLVGREFSSKCPPDVQHATRIIALCDIADVDRDLVENIILRLG